MVPSSIKNCNHEGITFTIRGIYLARSNHRKLANKQLHQRRKGYVRVDLHIEMRKKLVMGRQNVFTL